MLFLFFFFLACHVQRILKSFISSWSFIYSSTSCSSYNCFITGYFIRDWLLRYWLRFWTDCWDFDWCSAKFFRDCSWIISSSFWGGTVSFSFTKDESVSSKSNLKVSFDFHICPQFLQITVFLSVSILYDLLGMSDSMIIPLHDQDLSWCFWIDYLWFKGGRFFAFLLCDCLSSWEGDGRVVRRFQFINIVNACNHCALTSNF